MWIKPSVNYLDMPAMSGYKLNAALILRYWGVATCSVTGSDLRPFVT